MPHRPELAPLAYRNDRRRRISTAVVLGVISLMALPFWLMHAPEGAKVIAVLYAVVMTAAASLSAHLWLGVRPRLRMPSPEPLPFAEPLASADAPDTPPVPLTYAARLPPPPSRGFTWWVDLVILPICLSLLALAGWTMLNCCLVPEARVRVILAALPGSICFLLACRPSTPRTANTHLWWLIGTSITLLTTPLASIMPQR